MHSHVSFRVIILIGLLVFVILFLLTHVAIIAYNGTPVAVPAIPRGPQQFGRGDKLTFAVMGDSTTIAQGASYAEGYAVQGAQHLALRYNVTLLNVGVSGAVARDVADLQLPEVVSYKPDVVLIAVGANDVTHFTRLDSIKQSMQTTIDGLKAANPNVRIVVTGSPAMDTVDRFPWTAKQVALSRVRAVNALFADLVTRNDLIFAPIAEQTRAAFKADPTLFAQDKFHPNARGYALWIPIINRALDEAMQ